MRNVRWMAFWVMTLVVVAMPADASAQELRWADLFGAPGASVDVVYAVDVSAGDVYAAGEVGGLLEGQAWGGSCDAVVRKLTGAGAVRWTRQFGADGCDFANGVAAASDGVYVVGSFEVVDEGTPTGVFDGFVRKYDPDGNELWTHRIGTGDFVTVNGAVAESGGVYAVGQVCGALPGQQPVGACDAFVRRYDAQGNEVWTRQFGAGTFSAANWIDVSASNVAVVGRVAGALPGQQVAGGRDVFVRLYDSRGRERWTRQFGTPGNDIAWGVDIEGRGLYVSGEVGGGLPGFEFSGGPIDAFVRAYDLRGNEQWTHQFGTDGFDRAIRVAADSDKVAVVGRIGAPGRENLFGGPTDAFVRTYDRDGNENWMLQRFGEGVTWGVAIGVALDNGDIFVGGAVAGELSDDQTVAGVIDAFVLKVLDQTGF